MKISGDDVDVYADPGRTKSCATFNIRTPVGKTTLYNAIDREEWRSWTDFAWDRLQV